METQSCLSTTRMPKRDGGAGADEEAKQADGVSRQEHDGQAEPELTGKTDEVLIRKGKKRPNAPTSPQRCVCVCARARVLKRCVCVCVCVFRFLYSRMSEGSAVRALSESL